jgi:hypothetical protein
MSYTDPEGRVMSLRFTRIASWFVPAGLVSYAGCRWLDGRDGHRGLSFWWDIGHGTFLLCWLAFAVLTIGMAGQLRSGIATVAARVVAAATMTGIVAFAWVTVTDILPSWPEVPGPLRAAGPPLFLAGFAILIGITARGQGNRRWFVFPVLTFLAVLAVSVSLALLPVTAVLFVVALDPCRGKPAKRGVPTASSGFLDR